MFEIIAIIYCIWAFYSGWKFMDGRVAFLEQSGFQYKLLKLVAAYFVGIIYGAIYLLQIVLKLLNMWS